MCARVPSQAFGMCAGLPVTPCSVCYCHRIKMLHSGVDRWHSSNQTKPLACLCFAFETKNLGRCCVLQQWVVWRSVMRGCLRVVTCNSFGDVALRACEWPQAAASVLTALFALASHCAVVCFTTA